jgi:hypothetical protein
MLQEADRSWFFCPPANVIADYPSIAVARSYSELKAGFAAAKLDLG